MERPQLRSPTQNRFWLGAWIGVLVGFALIGAASFVTKPGCSRASWRAKRLDAFAKQIPLP